MSESSLLTLSELARFNSFLDKNNEQFPDCWVWTGALAKGGGKRNKEYPGYPIFQSSSLRPRTQKAHRLAYRLWKRELAPGMQVQHSCNNPACCNPDHLLAGTPARNSAYMVFCGRAATGLRHGKGKLSEAEVRQIVDLCKERASNKRTKGNGNQAIYREIGVQFGVSEGHIRNIHRGYRRLQS